MAERVLITEVPSQMRGKGTLGDPLMILEGLEGLGASAMVPSADEESAGWGHGGPDHAAISAQEVISHVGYPFVGTNLFNNLGSDSSTSGRDQTSVAMALAMITSGQGAPDSSPQIDPQALLDPAYQLGAQTRARWGSSSRGGQSNLDLAVGAPLAKHAGIDALFKSRQLGLKTGGGAVEDVPLQVGHSPANVEVGSGPGSGLSQTTPSSDAPVSHDMGQVLAAPDGGKVMASYADSAKQVSAQAATVALQAAAALDHSPSLATRIQAGQALHVAVVKKTHADLIAAAYGNAAQYHADGDYVSAVRSAIIGQMLAKTDFQVQMPPGLTVADLQYAQGVVNAPPGSRVDAWNVRMPGVRPLPSINGRVVIPLGSSAMLPTSHGITPGLTGSGRGQAAQLAMQMLANGAGERAITDDGDESASVGTQPATSLMGFGDDFVPGLSLDDNTLAAQDSTLGMDSSLTDPTAGWGTSTNLTTTGVPSTFTASTPAQISAAGRSGGTPASTQTTGWGAAGSIFSSLTQATGAVLTTGATTGLFGAKAVPPGASAAQAAAAARAAAAAPGGSILTNAVRSVEAHPGTSVALLGALVGGGLLLAFLK